MKIIFGIATIVLMIAQPTMASSRWSLLEMDSLRIYLSLTENQHTVIAANVERIKAVLVKDKTVIENLKARIAKGDEPGFFEKIKVKRGRDDRIDAIEQLIIIIENQLNERQKILFVNVEKPVLKSLEKKEIFGEM